LCISWAETIQEKDMFRFLFKGIVRDHSRSLMPLLVIIVGVALTVILYSWVNGMFNNVIESNAKFQTGHVKIMSQAYAEQADKMPNDLAYIGVDTLLAALEKMYPEITWLPRIRFGGLLDVPDEAGETRAQGPAFGIAVDLLSENNRESDILNLKTSLVRGRLLQNSGEILISENFARKLEVYPGETVTLISTTMYGSLAVYNFTIAGTVRFGMAAMDRGAVIANLSDIQQALDMENSAGEILGLFNNFQYHEEDAYAAAAAFNNRFQNPGDPFSPLMITLRDQNGLAQMLDLAAFGIAIIIGIFLVVMFMVLWNVGLMGSLRRYGEIGVRLAIGEEKGHLYRSMLYESLILSVIGSLIGTAAGLAVSHYLQNNGINVASIMKNSSLMLSDVLRAEVRPGSYIIGFIPGIFAMLLGTAVSGIGIYKRQTSQLFKELET
jgi:putative ABC transport system permease protein